MNTERNIFRTRSQRGAWFAHFLCAARRVSIPTCLVAVALTPETVSAAEHEVAPKAAESLRDPFAGSIFVDPLGFLLFGPTAGIELGYGRFSASVYGRWLSVGILADSMFLNDHSHFTFSYGAGVRGRYYFQPELLGPHIGLGCELLRSRAEDPDVEKIAFIQSFLVPELEVGYRYGLGRFYVGASAYFGYAMNLTWSAENINGGTEAQYYSMERDNTIYASASLDLGLFF